MVKNPPDDSLEKSLMLGRIEGRRRRGHQRMRWRDRITDIMSMNLGKLWEMVRDGRPGVLQSMGLQRVGHDWVTGHHHSVLGFPCGAGGKEPVCNAGAMGDSGSIPGLDDKPYNHGVTYILFKASAFSPVKCGK